MDGVISFPVFTNMIATSAIDQTSKHGKLLALSPVLDWIDRELVEVLPFSPVVGANRLLELRGIFQKSDLTAVVRHFQAVLPRLEKTHFLLCYRIRQWIALNVEVEVSDLLGRAQSEVFPIQLKCRNVQAFRREFFEHASEVIPLEDIRVECVLKA